MAEERRGDPGSHRHLQSGPKRLIVGRCATDQLPGPDGHRAASRPQPSVIREAGAYRPGGSPPLNTRASRPDVKFRFRGDRVSVPRISSMALTSRVALPRRRLEAMLSRNSLEGTVKAVD